MFRFRDPADTAVLTCCHVLQGERPVLHVSHDREDGMWQFLCGVVHEEADARVIALSEAAALDPSLCWMAWLPRGYEANRRNRHTLWRVRRKR